MDWEPPSIDSDSSLNVVEPLQGKTYCVHKPDVESQEGRDRHLFILHGWNSTQTDMLPVVNELLKIPAVRQRHVWVPAYNTWRSGFDTAAVFVKRDLDREGFAFKDNVFLGYSMGGLVARQLIANGMQCSSLVTVCTPHEGILHNVPQIVWDKGQASMRYQSKELLALVEHERKLHYHHDLHCFGFGFFNSQYYTENDRIVPLHSALAHNMNTVDRRVSTRKALYVRDTWDYDIHHLKGMSPEYLGDVFRLLGRLV